MHLTRSLSRRNGLFTTRSRQQRGHLKAFEFLIRTREKGNCITSLDCLFIPHANEMRARAYACIYAQQNRGIN